VILFIVIIIIIMVFKKLSLCLSNWALCHQYIWGSGGIAPSFLTPGLAAGRRLASRPCRFIPEEKPSRAHRIGGWAGVRAGLDAMEKRRIWPLPRIELQPWNLQLVAIQTELSRILLICFYLEHNLPMLRYSSSPVPQLNVLLLLMQLVSLYFYRLVFKLK
jgi:hypothetical protein